MYVKFSMTTKQYNYMYAHLQNNNTDLTLVQSHT